MDVPTSHVMPANPPMLEGVEDLTQLSYLNEPSILHDLDYRFKQVRASHASNHRPAAWCTQSQSLASVSHLPTPGLKSGGAFGCRG
jgi:hypothetical protein